jgi:hypothetical protein
MIAGKMRSDLYIGEMWIGRVGLPMLANGETITPDGMKAALKKALSETQNPTDIKAISDILQNF